MRADQNEPITREANASTKGDWHVVIVKDADGSRHFYSSHDTEGEAKRVANAMNIAANDAGDLRAPSGFTYVVEVAGEFRPVK